MTLDGIFCADESLIRWLESDSSLQTYNSWQKGILFRWPVSMEQSPDVPEWSHT